MLGLLRVAATLQEELKEFKEQDDAVKNAFKEKYPHYEYIQHKFIRHITGVSDPIFKS